MNILETVVQAAKTYSPKHGGKFENALRDARTSDVSHLAHVFAYVCCENNIPQTMRNPFPADTREHDTWSVWIDENEAPSSMPAPAPLPVKQASAPVDGSEEDVDGIAYVGGGVYEVEGVGRIRGKDEAFAALKNFLGRMTGR